MNFDLQQSTIRLKNLCSSLLASYSEEDLHQLRVTLRRVRSALRETPAGNKGDLRRELGTLARATNSARDWDTLVASAHDQLGTEQLRALLPLLEEHRETAQAQVYRMLHSPRWLAALKAIDCELALTHSETDSKVIAAGQLQIKLQNTAAAGRKAMARDDDKSWHKLRIAIKELRYTLDTLPQGPADSATARLLDECKSLQTLLGDWHDTVVHRNLLDELADPTSLYAATPASDAASALQHVLAANGQRSLEHIKQRLRRGGLAVAAQAAANISISETYPANSRR